MLQTLIARLFGWTAAVFYHVEQTGQRIPDGPVLVTANHQNALLDPLLVFRTVGRPARPLAKAPLFKQLFVGTMLRALGGVPVYRKQDDPSLMHKNDETFRKAIDALKAGDAVQIYPEGRSHTEPRLVELRTGAARIALGAESESGWKLGLQISPVGITYRRKPFFRGDALVVIDRPFTITDLQREYERDAQECVRVLTDRMAARLHAITLNLAQHEDRELIETAEALYARAKGLATPREREPMAERLPRLQRFAEGLAWLRANDPARHDRLARAVARYRKIASLLGAQEADVPRSYSTSSVIGYGVREVLYLLVGAPAAILGMALWYPPYLLTRIAVKLINPVFESQATYKLASAIFAFPLFLALYVFLGFRLGGIAAAGAVALALPVMGLVALAWRDRWARLGEDTRLFLRALPQRRTRDRLAHYREQLVREFDAIDEAMNQHKTMDAVL